MSKETVTISASEYAEYTALKAAGSRRGSKGNSMGSKLLSMLESSPNKFVTYDEVTKEFGAVTNWPLADPVYNARQILKAVGDNRAIVTKQGSGYALIG